MYYFTQHHSQKSHGQTEFFGVLEYCAPSAAWVSAWMALHYSLSVFILFAATGFLLSVWPFPQSCLTLAHHPLAASSTL